MSEARDPRTNPRRGDVLLKGQSITSGVRRNVLDNNEGMVFYDELTIEQEDAGSCALFQWCTWAVGTDVIEVGNYDGPPRDPRTMPVNGDVLCRTDLEMQARSVRQVLGTTEMRLHDSVSVEVQYRLTRSSRQPMRSCSLMAWRKWASKAEVE